jgi:hypothetical protein
MESAARGESLDFSMVQREQISRQNTARLALADQTVNDLRQRLIERKERAGQEIRKPTEPVYDDVYAKACRVMDEEEGRGSNFRI